MADTIPPVLIELQLETAKIAAQMQQLQSNFAEFGKTVEKQGGFLEKFKATASGVFAGNLMVTGLNAIKGAIGGAIQDAQQYEVLLNQTAAVIKSTGNAAGISVASLKAHASQLENISAVDENLILHGENVIATFTNIRNVAGAGNDVFDQTTKAALDLSVALGQDMQSSAIQLGKALNDPIKGVSALTRVGVTFSEEQKKMIATLQNSGDTLGAQKIILAEVNREFGGAAKAAGDTFAGAVSRAKDKAQDFARDLVTNLQPILLSIGKVIGEIYNNTLKPLFSWITKNKEAVALFVGILATAYAAFKAYTFILGAVEAATTLYTVAVALMAGAQLEDVVATEAQTGAMTLLNAVLNANPIGLVVLALAALAAGFVYAWNHSETFRKIVVKVADGVLSYISFMIKAWGQMIEVILKVVTGPLQLFLNVISKLPGIGDAAKAGLKLIHDGINAVGDFADSAAKKVDGLKAKIDSLANTKIKLPSFGGADTTTSGGSTGGAAAPDAGQSAAATKAAATAAAANVKAIAAAQKEVTSIYDKMTTAMTEGNKKAAEATKKNDAKVADTKAQYAAKEIEITKKKNDELKANEDAWTAERLKARENAAARDAKITADYAKKKAQIESDYASKIADLQKAADTKIANERQAAAEKQAAIIQESIDQLRSAFATGTSATISDIFKSGATSADAMIEQLKSKLADAKELQKNAALLQAAGYSQVFIEDVVKNGPAVGNEMAKAILSADADTQKQMKDLYGEVNNISAHGLDVLATTMNAGANLATEEMMKAYNQVPIDLANAISTTNTELTDALASANADYLSKLNDAAAARDSSLADSKAALEDALQAADSKLAEANAKTIADFKDALAQNGKDLADALAQIQSDYNDTIAQIAQDTQDKLASLQSDLDAAIQKLKDLGAAKQAADAAVNNPSASYSPNYQPSTQGRVDANGNIEYYDPVKAAALNGNRNYVYNYNVTGVNLADPNAAAKAIDSAVKFGTPQALSVGTSNKLQAMGLL